MSLCCPLRRLYSMAVSLPHSSVLPFLLVLPLSCLALLLFSLYLSLFCNKPNKAEREQPEQRQRHQHLSDNVTEASDVPEWAAPGSQDVSGGKEGAGDGEERKKRKKGRKKKRKKGRKKKQELAAAASDGANCCAEKEKSDLIAMMAIVVTRKVGEDSLYPFSSSASVTQRRIKQQYDLIVKSNANRALTVAQVGQFANCLIEARNELKHKSETIHRKFTITKALLFKADRSSFGRLSQQICKLEIEQKRLEEDALVYNRIQEQLKSSPAFKTMLETGMQMESNAKPDKATNTMDLEYTGISFEELLAQEKKDSFWQRNGKMRSCTS